MVRNQCVLGVTDNSGVTHVKFIKVLRKQHIVAGVVGDVFVGIVIGSKKRRSKVYLKKGTIVIGLIVRTVKESLTNVRFSGIYHKTLRKNGSVILLKNYDSVINSYGFYGTRVFGPISSILLQRRHVKLKGFAEMFFVLYF